MERVSLEATLKRAQQVLEILEGQSAGYTALTIPAHLQIELAEKRQEVANLEAQLQAILPPISPTSPTSRLPKIGAIEIFFSYAHKDEALRDELAKHLSLLVNQDIIKAWCERDISAGAEWDATIKQRLNAAQIILLLVSADFLASPYIWGVELQQAMERHEAGEARVIPIILRPCDWKNARFGKLQALPKNAEPITTWKNRDEAFLSVVEAIRKVCGELNTGGLKPIRKPLLSDSFEFNFVTVDGQGQIINQSPGEARCIVKMLGGAVPLKMVLVVGGTFEMGSPVGEKKRISTVEHPLHLVAVQPFWIGKYPITQAQWKAIASRTDLKVERDLDANPAYFKDREDSDRRPVEQVSWYDALEFCKRLSKLTGRECRLPSEAEWEYLCRAGTKTPFHCGETITGELANYCASKVYREESKGMEQQQTTSVDKFRPNAFGVYDLHGNVREWCADPWHDCYESLSKKAPTDGSSWEVGADKNYRVVRGGSWKSSPQYCRSAYRECLCAKTNRYDVGFRVASSWSIGDDINN